MEREIKNFKIQRPVTAISYSSWEKQEQTWKRASDETDDRGEGENNARLRPCPFKKPFIIKILFNQSLGTP